MCAYETGGECRRRVAEAGTSHSYQVAVVQTAAHGVLQTCKQHRLSLSLTHDVTRLDLS